MGAIGRLLRGHPAETGSVSVQEEAHGERVANLLRIAYTALWMLGVTAAIPIHLPCFSVANIGAGSCGSASASSITSTSCAVRTGRP